MSLFSDSKTRNYKQYSTSSQKFKSILISASLYREKGISLSGGQKARLQLARAVYARADVYLLDDILSAVDQHVGRHIINQVVGPKGLLRGKTRILATNSIPVLKEADHILMISGGRIMEEGSYWDAIAKDGEIAALIKTVKTSNDHIDSPSPSSASSPVKVKSGMDSGEESDEDILEPFNEKDIVSDKELEGRASMTSLRRASTSSFGRPGKGDEELALLPVVKSRQTKEISEKGKVKWSVYTAYARACNARAVCIWIFTIVAVQVSGMKGPYNPKNMF
jgi:ATP-binding cassette subfamily C (CFTR/MRP) protein 1